MTWQSMSTAPKSNEEILVIDEHYERTIVAWNASGLMWVDSHDYIYKPRCWHLLPDILTHGDVEAIG